MSKRAPQFLRRERDLYQTPLAPVKVLLPHLTDVNGFCEPCCGDGALIRHLEAKGHVCTLAADLEPTGDMVGYAAKQDAMRLVSEDLGTATHVITNPPWPAPRDGGQPTLDLIWHLTALRPTWLLLSADFMHNSYARMVLRMCPAIVSVGRVKWITDSPHVGKDNVCWYLFDRAYDGYPYFYPRPLKIL